jgi:predicted AlkP superfamily pyrophosphatase or phosphodiesterase
MKRLLAILLVLTAAVGAALAAPARDADVRLVLLIAVDQFRYDYLTRFRSEFHQGFDRLLSHGAVFTDASLEHYPTVTAIGHSTMLTGATPSVSGIVGNDWYDRETAQTVTSVSDPGVQLLGAEGTAASPHRLLVSTVGDEIKLAAGVPRGATEGPRVIGISLKDRSAILPAGHAADAAYWWDQSSGHFVTSTFYRSTLPDWVSAFNAKRLPDSFAGRTWSLLTSPSTTLRQMPAEAGQSLYQAVYGSPFGNEVLLGFVQTALEHEQLGQRGVTDLLSVSFSSNDSVGHTYGPDSPELRDITIRTDAFIGTLLDRVDALVGLDHTIVAFTADHGVAPTPEVLASHGLPAGRMASKDLFDPIEQALVQRFGEGKWILATAGSSPYFDYDLMAKLKADPVEVRRVAAAAAAKVPHVARVYTRDQLMHGEVYADRIGRRILSGFNQERSGDLEIVLEPYWLRQAKGATHGTPYNYDAHIPLILMGPRVQAGEYDEHVALNDLAPTLATLVHVEIPAGSSGRVLTEALRPQERPAATATR